MLSFSDIDIAMRLSRHEQNSRREASDRLLATLNAEIARFGTPAIPKYNLPEAGEQQEALASFLAGKRHPAQHHHVRSRDGRWIGLTLASVPNGAAFDVTVAKKNVPDLTDGTIQMLVKRARSVVSPLHPWEKKGVEIILTGIRGNPVVVQSALAPLKWGLPENYMVLFKRRGSSDTVYVAIASTENPNRRGR